MARAGAGAARGKGELVKVTGLKTLRLAEFPNLCWVTIETDEGVSGLGETFFGAAAVEAYLHESVAPYLLGRDPLLIDKHAVHTLCDLIQVLYIN